MIEANECSDKLDQPMGFFFSACKFMAKNFRFVTNSVHLLLESVLTPREKKDDRLKFRLYLTKLETTETAFILLDKNNFEPASQPTFSTCSSSKSLEAHLLASFSWVVFTCLMLFTHSIIRFTTSLLEAVARYRAQSASEGKCDTF